MAIADHSGTKAFTAGPAGPARIWQDHAPPLIRRLRAASYQPTLEEMRSFTAHRDPQTPDEIWLVEHEPVYTQGLAGRPQHLREPGAIPVVQTERGGQVTYHGPGQVVAYLMMDLRRMGLSIRSFVCAIEQGVIDYLGHWKVAAVRQPGAPGVYLQAPPHGSGAKIASLGIKISRGCSYHGVALNADMDLEPFARIDPCGYPGLAVTDLRSALGLPRGALDLSMLAQTLASCLSDAIGAAAASAVQTCGAAQVAAPSSQTR